MSQMEVEPYAEPSLDLAVDLVNTYDPETGANDGLPDLSSLSTFLSGHDVRDAGRPSRTDLSEIHRLAARLRGVFDASDERDAASVLNEVLAESGGHLELISEAGGSWHLHYSPASASLASRLAAEAAMALAIVIAHGEFARLQVCQGDRCVDAFVDRSRNRSRRYCSPEVCGNRASVAAYRERQRSARGAGAGSKGTSI